MEHMSQILLTMKLKEHIVFHYLLKEILLCAFIFLKLDIFLKKKMDDKSITHIIFRIQSNDCIICGFCCVEFSSIVFIIYDCRKVFL